MHRTGGDDEFFCYEGNVLSTLLPLKRRDVVILGCVRGVTVGRLEGITNPKVLGFGSRGLSSNY